MCGLYMFRMGHLGRYTRFDMMDALLSRSGIAAD
jgi:hypothetical protein